MIIASGPETTGRFSSDGADPHRDPSEVDADRHWFDDVAEVTSEFTSRSAFFITLVVLLLAWLPTYFLFGSVDSWYIAMVIPAEVLTLLLVALLENNNRRSEKALHRKLDAFAAALAAMAAESSSAAVRKHATELQAAIGLQDRESTDE